MNRDDYRHCLETWEALQEPCPCCDPEDDCDCHASEIVMLSTGYAEVYQDGSVSYCGGFLADLDSVSEADFPEEV